MLPMRAPIVFKIKGFMISEYPSRERRTRGGNQGGYFAARRLSSDRLPLDDMALDDIESLKVTMVLTVQEQVQGVVVMVEER